MSTIEISVRKFFVTEEGLEVVPTLRFTVENTSNLTPENFIKVSERFNDLAKSMSEHLGDLREMTKEEIDDYTRRERENMAAGLVGLVSAGDA